MSKKQKRALTEIIASTLLFMTGALLSDSVIKAVLYVAAYFVVGGGVLYKAACNLFRGNLFDECFLMALATVGAFAVGEYPEAVAVMLFYQIGEFFQGLAVGKSRKSIASLMDIRPETARLLRNGEEITVSPEEIAVGDILIVRPGERIPVDGVITEGSAAVDASCMTGESLPVNKVTGEEVISGTVSTDGVIYIKATAVYSDSAVAKILKLVEEASSKKAKTENFITRFAKYYTPSVVIGALLLFLIPSLITLEWAKWLNRALIFLVVSCPCALVISVPLSFFGGIGGCSRKGILVKGAVNLETLARANTVFFDKTGTLTYGKFHIEAVLTDGISEEELLGTASAVEACSNHPVAQCIASEGEKYSVGYSVCNIKELSGRGISAELDGRHCLVGNKALMEEYGISVTRSAEYGTEVHIAEDGRYLGCIAVADEIKENTVSVVEALHGMGIKKAVMLTGDKHENAEHIAGSACIDEFYAQLLPEQKSERLEESKRSGAVTVFVGDGINDAPVLTAADVGIAMGALGSDAAIEAADIVITDDNISKIPVAVEISRKTMRIVKQNIVFALLVKGIILLLGALGAANMWLAVFGDVGVSMAAILNAMRTLVTKTNE